ncbi:hypothetical protein OAU26_07390 [Mariniblastus sp.]|nr:hypothetical protein [Mariniblastus sp.]MDC3224739.1 hypothetical protein [Mariniblastus sp.]
MIFPDAVHDWKPKLLISLHQQRTHHDTQDRDIAVALDQIRATLHMRDTLGQWLRTGRALRSGRKGRWFKSSHPDSYFLTPRATCPD